MNQKERILKMVEEGKITSQEGLELLDALNEEDGGNQAASPQVETRSKKGKYDTLKIQVQVEEDDTNVNVNVPLGLVKVLGGAADSFDKFIPEEAKETMEDKGVHFSGSDIVKMIEAIENGTLEDPTIVDIDVNDKDDGYTKVKIYVD